MKRLKSAVVALTLLLGVTSLAGAQTPSPARPFGTLREQAAMQQDWLTKRLDTFLAPLMRRFQATN